MDFFPSFCEKFEELNISDKSNFIVGLSGGPDSVCLLILLSRLVKSQNRGNRIYAVHVNHGLRGDDADMDEAFCEDLCESLGIPLKKVKVDIAHESKILQKSEEETGRIFRYKAFDDCAKEIFESQNKYESLIFTAHHADDFAETVLMNIFRGCGSDGLAPMRKVNGKFVRPLLSFTKEQIVDFLNEEKISYREDKTNLSCDYTRNIWRNKILPEISEVSVKKPSTALWDLSCLVSEDLDFINETVDKLFIDNIDFVSNSLPKSLIAEGKPACSKRLIRKLFAVSNGNLVDFEQVNVNDVYELAFKDDGKTINLPFNNTAYVYNGRIGILSEEELEALHYSDAEQKGFLVLPEIFCVKITSKDLETGRFSAKIPNSNITIIAEIIENISSLKYNNLSWFLPVDTLSDLPDLFIGNGCSDKVFKRAGSSASKKLNKHLSEMKVFPSVRDLVLTVYDEGDALWIPGLGHSEGFTGELSRERYEMSLKDLGKSDKSKLLRIEFIKGQTSED